MVKGKDIWFKNKTYGYGWAPATKEGWIVMLIFIILYIAVIMTGLHYASTEKELYLYVIVPEFVLVIILLIICYKKGERLKWTWG